MGVDEPGRDDRAAEVDPLVRRGRLAASDRRDEAVATSTQPVGVLGVPASSIVQTQPFSSSSDIGDPTIPRAALYGRRRDFV